MHAAAESKVRLHPYAQHQGQPHDARRPLNGRWRERMMAPGNAVAQVVPLGAKRHVSTTDGDPASDPRYWASQMSAVALQRDRASFIRIYDHFAPRLRRYLRNLGVAEHLADELVQDALLTLWRKATQFDPARASLGTWLFRIGRNLYIDHVRREPHWIPVQEGLDRLDLAESDRRDSQPESFTDQDILNQAIDRLPPVQAKLVRMSYLEAKSHSEISSELDMPLGTVKSSLRRAFAKLQDSMRATR